MNRRTYLSALGAGLATLSGCTASALSNKNSSSSEYPTEPVRGKAEAITTQRKITRDSVAYLEKTHEVRIVAAYRHTNHEAVENGAPPEREPVHESIPFERWAETESAFVGAEAVQTAIFDQTSNGEQSISVGVSGENKEHQIRVHHLNDSPIAFDKLVALTPRSVTATISISGVIHTATYPVTVTHTELRFE
ncbi:hypothetical protein [Halogranum amylolyticum]|nr:hypothetical protein [Halogranum amylolyticum]